MTDDPRPRAVLIELDAAPVAGPEAAPPVPELLQGQAAMQRAVAFAARPGGGGLSAWFWSLAGALVSFVAGLAAWDYVAGLAARAPALGAIGAGLAIAFTLVLVLVALRELVAFARIARLDRVQKAAARALADADLAAAKDVVRQVQALYAGRSDLAWGRARLAEADADLLDADALLALADTMLIAPLDRAAEAEVQVAARQVATVTALVPLPLADIATALLANLRMIRRIAEIYGGRGGVLGAWRLTRVVMTHLVATGAIAVGDDLIGAVAGGGLLSKLSRRFGEGVVNAGLTARVGVAAIEVCRPLPFRAGARPSVSAIALRALRGLFGSAAQDKSGGA